MSKHWFEKFAGFFGFPENYTTIDLETNGLKLPRKDARHSMICTFGWSVVRDRQIVETKEVAINWEESGLVDRDEFLTGLAGAEQGLRSKGREFHHTPAYLREYGVQPIDGLRQLLDLVETAEERKEVLVTQNGWRYDIVLMEAHFNNFLNISWKFLPNLVFDTGICEKASQLGDRDHPLPMPGETMKQFAWRIGELQRRGVMWALDGHCQERYGLFDKAGIPLSEAHRSGKDSVVLHHLFEEHRKLAGVADQVRDPLSYNVEAVTQEEDPLP